MFSALRWGALSFRLQRCSLANGSLFHVLTANNFPGRETTGQRGLPQITVFREYVTTQSKQHSQTQIVGYSPQQVYDVVANVPEYDQFLPWCVGSRVVRNIDDTHFDAELTIGFQLLKEQYTSYVTLRPASSPNSACSVISHVGDSLLFTHLDSTWVLVKGPAEGTCLIKFNVDFGFKSSLYRSVANVFFDEVVKKMMGAFVGRCRVKYGECSLPQRLQQGAKQTYQQPLRYPKLAQQQAQPLGNQGAEQTVLGQHHCCGQQQQMRQQQQVGLQQAGGVQNLKADYQQSLVVGDSRKVHVSRDEKLVTAKQEQRVVGGQQSQQPSSRVMQQQHHVSVATQHVPRKVSQQQKPHASKATPLNPPLQRPQPPQQQSVQPRQAMRS